MERAGETVIFAVERAMEEESAFVKYNNNSGFVDYGTDGGDGAIAHPHRFTPHAFSRFTFDRSAGELMVVDIQVSRAAAPSAARQSLHATLCIRPVRARLLNRPVALASPQGCDDVYTDPQIHTQLGTDYGDGNLGVGGMALFFSTSVYDSLYEQRGA